MIAVALALAASTAWGCSQFLVGLQGRRVALLALATGAQGAGLVLIGAVVLVRGVGPPGLESALFALVAGVGAAGTVAVFYRALAIGALGIVAPIVGTAGAVPVAFGMLTGERPGGLAGVGVVLALLGVVLASFQPRGTLGGRVATGVGLALVATLGIGIFFVLISLASRADPYWAVLLSHSASFGLLGAAALVVRPSLAFSRADGGRIAVAGLLDTGGSAMFAVASTLGLVSIVAVLASLYPVVTIVLARVVLRERLRVAQRAGALVAIAGAATIAAG